MRTETFARWLVVINVAVVVLILVAEGVFSHPDWRFSVHVMDALNIWRINTLILTLMVFAHVDVAHRKLRIALLLSWGLSGHSILDTYIGPYFRWH